MCGVGGGHSLCPCPRNRGGRRLRSALGLGRRLIRHGSGWLGRRSIDLLAGEGPADAAELTYALGVEMLLLAGITTAAEHGLTADGMLERAVEVK